MAALLLLLIQGGHIILKSITSAFDDTERRSTSLYQNVHFFILSKNGMSLH